MSNATSIRDLLRWEELDFAANCEVWGNWLATLILPNPWDPAKSLDGSISLTLQLLVASVNPATLGDVMSANVTEVELAGEVMGWWTQQMYGVVMGAGGETGTIDADSDFWKNVVVNPGQKCPESLCKAFGYSGNDDITGIGVHSSYYTQAVLATLYLVVFTVAAVRNSFSTKDRSHLGQPLLSEPREYPSRIPNNTKLTLGKRTLDAFRGSLDAFLTTSMLMCVAMLCAAISFAVEGVKERRAPVLEQVLPYGDSEVYNVVLSVIAAGFSVFPVVVIYLLISRRDRGGVGMPEGLPLPPFLRKHGRRTELSVGHRAWIRRAAMFIIWVLITVEVFLSPRGNMDYDLRHNPDEDSDYNLCNRRGGARYWQTMKAAQWLVIGAPLLWMAITAFLATGFGIHGLASSRLVRGVRSVWDLAVAWLNLLLAWGLLAYFTIFRNEIIDTAEEVNSGNEWGFGQILALATWMPVVLEFLYIFIWGIENRLNSHLLYGLPAGRDPRCQQPSTSGTWAALASKPSDADLGPSRSETLVAYPYEGAGGARQKPVWEAPVELTPLNEPPRVGEIRSRVDSGNTLYER